MIGGPDEAKDYGLVLKQGESETLWSTEVKVATLQLGWNSKQKRKLSGSRYTIGEKTGL